VGNQLDKNTNIGPLVDSQQFEKVLHYIKRGLDQGAVLEAGGKRVGKEGYFVEPTVFSGVTDNMDIAREEIFGPVQSLIRFTDEDDVIGRCNASTYGLAAGVVTNQIGHVFRVANQVKAGTVWVNTYHVIFPNAEFGGFRQSGFGREGGVDGISEWTITKTVIVNTNPPLSSKL